eukprot:364969-Chlamydomonas_euryale.AAC.2
MQRQRAACWCSSWMTMRHRGLFDTAGSKPALQGLTGTTWPRSFCQPPSPALAIQQHFVMTLGPTPHDPCPPVTLAPSGAWCCVAPGRCRRQSQRRCGRAASAEALRHPHQTDSRAATQRSGKRSGMATQAA